MNPFFFALTISLLGILTQPILCWGNLGHRTIAYLAEKHLTAEGVAYAKHWLRNEDISDAAIWADEFKNTSSGASTGSWHFIDAKDNPPWTCNLQVSRDCSDQHSCIIVAISNMTRRLNDSTLPFEERYTAFKFILHLIGDIHSPLHAESIARGGNDIEVLFDGHETNLHFIWDVDILLKRTRSTHEHERSVAKSWASELFNNDTRKVLCGITPQDVQYVNSKCLEQHIFAWAAEANAWVCKYVIEGGIEAIKGQELAGSYYEAAVPIVDDLIAKAGRRLGMWINALAAKGNFGMLQNVKIEL